MEGQKQAGGFAQAALGAIAHDGPADLLGRGKTGAHRTVGIVAPGAHLNDNARPGLAGAVAGAQKIAPLRDPRGAIGELRCYAVRRAQAESRLRPLDRRRAMIWRPAFVAMRERKP